MKKGGRIHKNIPHPSGKLKKPRSGNRAVSVWDGKDGEILLYPLQLPSLPGLRLAGRIPAEVTKSCLLLCFLQSTFIHFILHRLKCMRLTCRTAERWYKPKQHVNHSNSFSLCQVSPRSKEETNLI